MIDKEVLRHFYENELKQKLSGLEAFRKVLKNRDMLVIFLFLLPLLMLGVFFLFFSDKEPNPYLLFLVFAPVLVAIILIILNIKKKKIFRNRYKNEVVMEIVKAINPEWNYYPDQSITTYEYHQSELFQYPYDRYKGDDLISGFIDKTDFRCSELHTEYKTVTTDKDGKQTESWHTIFKGLFFHADFNKNIVGKTFVEPDVAEKLFGKFGQKLQISNKGKLVKLENPTFEKIFAVFSTDQTEARYILTPAIMEALVNIYNRYKRPMHLSFIGDRVYCAMGFTKDLFEPKVWRTLVVFKDVEMMFDLMMLNEKIISELNLNTRIWTKE